VNDEVRRALETDRTIDITTTGRKSGRPRRLEMWFHNVNGRIFITGMPGRRSWYANLVANPALTFHLKESVRADLAATARAITDPAERRIVLETIVGRLGHSGDIDRWVASSPLVEISFA
jgi:deazaflavin-dependent oxidoreductase (nitroreductase family)